MLAWIDTLKTRALPAQKPELNLTCKLAVGLVALPLLLAGAYYGLMAQDRYVSESQVVVKRAGDSAAASLNLGALIGVGGSTSREDAMLLQQYIHSPDMLARLDQQLGLRAAFGNAGADWFYRLSPDATREEFLDYYRSRVEVGYDDKTTLLTLRTQGFTPAFAQRFNQALLAECERFINELSHKITREEMAFASAEVERSYQALNGAKENLLRYQNQHGVLDPQAQAEAASRLVAELQAKQAQLEAEQRNLESYLDAASPQVVAARNAVAAVKAQISAEKAKIVSPDDGRLNRKSAQFQELQARVEFGASLYKVALTALEKARVEAARKVKSLAVVTTAQLPEEAEYPRKLYILGSLLLACTMLFAVVRLTLSIIEDHRT